MKTETLKMLMVGSCVAGGALFGGLVAGFSQWTGEGDFPSRFNCLVVLASALGSMFSALAGFLSNSFSAFVKARNGNGTLPNLLDTGGKPGQTPSQT